MTEEVTPDEVTPEPPPPNPEPPEEESTCPPELRAEPREGQPWGLTDYSEEGDNGTQESVDTVT